MLFCRKCGAKLPDDSAFCGKCGTAVVIEAQEEPEDTSSEAESASPKAESTSSKAESASPKIESASSKVALSKSFPKATRAGSDGSKKGKAAAESAEENPSMTDDEVSSESVGAPVRQAQAKKGPNPIKRFLADRSVYTYAAVYFAVVAGLLVAAIVGVFGYCATQEGSIDEEINSYHLVIDTHLLSGYGLPYEAAETSSVASARNRALSLATGDSAASAPETDQPASKDTKK